MRLARSVATLARSAALAMFQRQLGVRIGRELLRLRFVAGGANFCAHEVRRVRIFGLRGCRLRCRINFVSGGSKYGSAKDAAADREYPTRSPQRTRPRLPTNRQSRPSTLAMHRKVTWPHHFS